MTDPEHEPGRAATDHVPAPAGPTRALAALCITEVTSWGVLYYAFPVLLVALTRSTGWSTAQAIGAFSTGALVAAAASVPVGRLIDTRGPRVVMTSGSVLGVLAVVAIAAAPGLGWFYLAWALAGLAQAATLYPPAFAALTGWYPPAGRIRALTTLTLAAGLASTVFAPLTAALLGALSWRQTYLVLAGVLALVTIPLHACCLTPRWPGRRQRDPAVRAEDLAHSASVLRSRPFLVLVAVMTLTGFGSYAATINLVPLLTGRGYSTGFAAWALGLVGVGQVLGRTGYGALARRSSTRVRTAVIPAAAAVCVAALGLLPGPAATLIALAVLAGAARGAHTLLQASAVADRWGTRAFGRVNGVFSAPITAAIALAPAGGTLVADRVGGYPTGFAVLAALTALASIAALATDPPRAPT
ncbi:MAG: hypothetical protein QOF99_1603 [Pseudonocardiales bacterium]|nr:hypothetical protein [Pseudonocardiales bacterium]